MSDEPETLTTPSKLPSSSKQNDSDLCIICQKLKESRRCTKLTSTVDGRSKIMETSKLLNDKLLVHLSNNELSEIKYHGKTCYARYKRSGERHAKRTIDNAEFSDSNDSMQTPEVRPKRAKIATNTHLRDKPCIICNQVTFKVVTKRFRICEDEPAQNVLKAAASDKDIVHTRCILYKTTTGKM